MDPALERLNSQSEDLTRTELLKCCGSRGFINRLLEQRPFSDLEDLLAKAEATWWSLDEAEWLQAFRSHPKIGERKAAEKTSIAAERWSEQEQSGVRNAGAATLELLADLNQEYEAKFGYIFIVCATGKSSEEMISLLRQRLLNAPEAELRVAAAEQQKITQLRLKKLLNQ